MAVSPESLTISPSRAPSSTTSSRLDFMTGQLDFFVFQHLPSTTASDELAKNSKLIVVFMIVVICCVVLVAVVLTIIVLVPNIRSKIFPSKGIRNQIKETIKKSE